MSLQEGTTITLCLPCFIACVTRIPGFPAKTLRLACPIISDIDFVAEEARYFAMGLTEDNAYLRVRGHNLYDLLKCMGHQLCSAQQVDFENQILNASVPSEGSYWEIYCSAGDLRHILI